MTVNLPTSDFVVSVLLFNFPVGSLSAPSDDHNILSFVGSAFMLVFLLPVLSQMIINLLLSYLSCACDCKVKVMYMRIIICACY